MGCYKKKTSRFCVYPFSYRVNCVVRSWGCYSLDILEVQYIHSNLIHQVNDRIKLHICSCTSKHYNVGQRIGVTLRYFSTQHGKTCELGR